MAVQNKHLHYICNLALTQSIIDGGKHTREPNHCLKVSQKNKSECH